MSRPILLLIVGSEGYGVRRALLGIVQGLGDRGRTVRIAALEQGPLTEAFRRLGHEVTLAPGAARPPVRKGRLSRLPSLARRWASQVKLIPWLIRQIRGCEPSTLLFRSPAEILLAGVASRRTGTKAFWLMPNTVSCDYPFDFNRVIYRILFKYTGVIPIANSYHTASTLGPGINPRYVVHLGVDPKRFGPGGASADIHSMLKIPPQSPVAGLFARLVEPKGHLIVLQALAIARSAELHLLVCGNGSDRSYAKRIESLIDDLGLRERVHMLGAVEDVERYYRSCDFVINSNIDAEPFGLSVVEAMMAGRPVLAHKKGGPGETVVDGVTGWHVESPTIDAFVRGFERAIQDRPRWGAMGAAASEHGERHFSTNAMMDRLLAVVDGRAQPLPVAEEG